MQGAGRHDNVGRSGHDPAGAPDPVRQHGSQFGVTDWVAVVGGRRLQRSSRAPSPRAQREEREVGPAGTQIEPRGSLRTGSANDRISATTARGRIAEPTRSADEGDSMSRVTNVLWLRRPSTIPSATSRP